MNPEKHLLHWQFKNLELSPSSKVCRYQLITPQLLLYFHLKRSSLLSCIITCEFPSWEWGLKFKHLFSFSIFPRSSRLMCLFRSFLHNLFKIGNFLFTDAGLCLQSQVVITEKNSLLRFQKTKTNKTKKPHKKPETNGEFSAVWGNSFNKQAETTPER